jgi:RNase H-fold protein (predicted Holliday junction resolvase)
VRAAVVDREHLPIVVDDEDGTTVEADDAVPVVAEFVKGADRLCVG